ncbi:hypothetical protein P7L68_03500 (plasmid) [Tistrella mobilis]|uniref:hypothetical protein n=1 Tax=Tistrella mobilis TaxID=171437 RepID=UPI00355644D9
MRIQFADLARPKQAAKYLTKTSSTLKLSTVHEVIAQALGYRGWHDLTSTERSCAAPTTSPPPTPTDAVEVILRLSDRLNIDAVDVQYIISRSHLLRNDQWSLAEQLSIRCAIWRQRVFGPPGRGKPGTIVKDRAYGKGMPCYLRKGGKPTHVLFDTGFGTRSDFEVVTPKIPLADFVPSRLWLPYGYWTLNDGSQVIFSRDYLPMWRISAAGTERLDPWLWIEGITGQSYFPQPNTPDIWASGTARERALKHLAEHRIFYLPKLVDVMPHLFETDVDDIRKGVRHLYEKVKNGEKLPSYAELNPYICSI